MREVEVNVYKQDGAVAGTRSLNGKIFEAPHRPHMLQEAVKIYLANQRSGTASTRTRGEVHRTGRKPWRQKGTGRARAGSARSPIWVGGGNTFGPKPRSFHTKMNKKAKRRALQSALSLRAADGDLVVLDEITLDAPRTKEMLQILSALGLGEERTLLVFGKKDENVVLSGRNIPWLDMTLADNLTTYRVLRAGKLVMTVEALDRLDERSW
jgi:large subunit ribosomal protein L4